MADKPTCHQMLYTGCRGYESPPVTIAVDKLGAKGWRRAARLPRGNTCLIQEFPINLVMRYGGDVDAVVDDVCLEMWTSDAPGGNAGPRGLRQRDLRMPLDRNKARKPSNLEGASTVVVRTSGQISRIVDKEDWNAYRDDPEQ